MHFYGLSYKEVMGLPLRTFWSLNSQIVRLRSEEQLSMVELFLLGGMGASADAITAIRTNLQKIVGEPLKVKGGEKDDLETTRQGIKALRQLKDRMSK